MNHLSESMTFLHFLLILLGLTVLSALILKILRNTLIFPQATSFFGSLFLYIRLKNRKSRMTKRYSHDNGTGSY